MATLTSQHQLSYNSSAVTYTTQATKRGWSIAMSVATNCISTAQYPATQNILETLVPDVLETECFNYRNVPFTEEVKDTEIAHLFEHILLHYLLEIKLRKSKRVVTYDGQTSWNWKKNPTGTFTITISGPKVAKAQFAAALKKATDVIETIFASKTANPSRALIAWKPSYLPEGSVLLGGRAGK